VLLSGFSNSGIDSALGHIQSAAENRQLRLYAVDFPEGKGFLQEDLVYSIEGSPSGTAFRTMKPLTLQSPFTGWLHYPIVQIANA
jgi:hypothetical protein